MAPRCFHGREMPCDRLLAPRVRASVPPCCPHSEERQLPEGQVSLSVSASSSATAETWDGSWVSDLVKYM